MAKMNNGENVEKTTKEKIAVMQAFVDGKPIEICEVGGNWISLHPDWKGQEVCWNWEEYDYRVAPPKPKEIWVNEYPSYLVVHHAKDAALKNAFPDATRKAVLYREVVE